jgi:hypothetical protein
VTTCPNGHASTAEDYCDSCGARIDAVISAAPAAGPIGQLTEVLPEMTVTVSRPPVPLDPCPSCGESRSDRDLFCERCGYDYVTGSAPIDPPASTAEWTAVIVADRSQYERSAPSGLAFPETNGPMTLTLVDDEIDIGRAEAGGDPAVSRKHLTLVRRADGSYSVVDRGSTNGTTVNEDPAPIEADVPVPLDDGDRIHIGAWTMITVRHG